MGAMCAMCAMCAMGGGLPLADELTTAAPPVTWPRDGLPRGTVLFGYEVVGVLGRGGFGITYRAVDRINQHFALKECFPRQFAVRDGMAVCPADEDYAGQMFAKCLDSFTKEALALTRFSRSGAAGEGVVKVITSFETNGTAYIVMEFVEGASLEQMIARYPGGMPQAELAPIMRALAETLACVHGNGLLHRDLKPANVIMRADGRPVLLDFGAARVVRADGPMPSQIFTETYAPIEQIEGRAQGPFSDLYSLGVTCYQAVAGARFHSGAGSSERFRAALRREPDPLVPAAVIGAGRYDPALLRAIDALLQVEPDNRPQSVEEFLPYLAGSAIAFVPTEATRMAQAAGAHMRDAGAPPTHAAAAETVFAPAPAGGHSAMAAGRPADATVMAPRPPVPASSGVAKSGGAGRGWMLLAIAFLIAGGCAGGAYWYVHRPVAGSPTPVAAAATSDAAATRLADANADYARGDYARALAEFAAAADTGDPQAQYRLGYMHELGQGVPVDPAAAMGWYQKAAARNYAAAESQIGYLYESGFGAQQDYAAAEHWYREAAGQGFKTAEFNLGHLAEKGLGTKKDYGEARRWYALAAKHGSAAAQNALGVLYQNGLGVNRDDQQALAYYTQAADQGLAAAEYNLGQLYAKGIGVPVDMAAAHDWMTKAAAGNNNQAITWLAEH